MVSSSLKRHLYFTPTMARRHLASSTPIPFPPRGAFSFHESLDEEVTQYAHSQNFSSAKDILPFFSCLQKCRSFIVAFCLAQ